MRKVSTSAKRAFWIAILAAAVGLRSFSLSVGFWGDELASINTFGRFRPDTIREHPIGLDHPLSTMLSVSFMQLFGESEVVGRLPQLAAGLAFVPLAWLIAKELTRSTSVSLVVAFLAAVWPVHVQYSQTARGYALVTAFTSLALWILLKGIRRKKLPWTEAAAMTAALCLSMAAVLTSAIAVLGLAGVGGALVWDRWRQRDSSGDGMSATAFSIRAAAALVAAGLLAVLFYRPSLGYILECLKHPQGGYGAGAASSGFDEAALLLSGSCQALGSDGFPSFTWANGIVLAAAMVGVRIAFRRRAGRIVYAFVLGAPLALLAFPDSDGMPPGRHYLFLLPLVLVAVGWGAVRLVESLLETRFRLASRRHRRWTAAGLAALLFGSLSVRTLAQEHYPARLSRDLREIRQFARERIGPHDLVITCRSDIFNPLEWYLGMEVEKRTERIIRDRTLEGIWYAEVDMSRGSVLSKNRIMQERLVGHEVLMEPIYCPTASALPIPPNGCALAADFGIIRFYRLVFHKTCLSSFVSENENEPMWGYSVRSSRTGGPPPTVTHRIETDRPFEGGKALALALESGEIAELCGSERIGIVAEGDVWLVSVASLHTLRTLIPFFYACHDDGTVRCLPHFYLNDTIGDANHQTRHRLNDLPAWAPLATVTPLPSGSHSVMKGIALFKEEGVPESLIDGLRSYLVVFPTGKRTEEHREE